MIIIAEFWRIKQMPQKQEIVPLVFLDGPPREAVATGNNAAWLCKCGRTSPLLGRSGMFSGPTIGYNVNCPCGRSYYIQPKDKNLGKDLHVIEV
jgi:hypothetical protein